MANNEEQGHRFANIFSMFHPPEDKKARKAWTQQMAGIGVAAVTAIGAVAAMYRHEKSEAPTQKAKPSQPRQTKKRAKPRPRKKTQAKAQQPAS